MAVPHLDRMLANEAVASEHLDPVVGDLHRVRGRVAGGTDRFPGRLVPLLVDARRSLEHRSVPEGSFVVPTAQPLGLLAVHLLEPEAPDGIVAWGIAGVEPKLGRPLPYFRLPSALPGGSSRR